MNRSNDLDGLTRVAGSPGYDAAAPGVSTAASSSHNISNESALDRPPEERPQSPTLAHKICLLILCTDFLAGFANEFSFRLFHGKAYLSVAAVVLLPIAFLMTGNARQGLRVGLGKWWAAFGLWLAVCAPFSFWRSDTLILLSNYYLRSFLLYFVICACALTLRQLSKLMYTLGISTLLVVITCVLFGSTSDGRFSVLNSEFSFLSNANELALSLLFGIVILMYPFFQKGKLAKVASFFVMVAAGVYMLKTGSRGGLVASIALVTTMFSVSRNKLKMVALALPVLIVALIALPQDARHRLLQIAIDPEHQGAANEADASARASQVERENVFWESVRMTLEHPVLGIGPGEFAAAKWGENTAHGEWAPFLGTHNSYTQVSSEAGIPAFLFYIGSIIICFRMNYRLYKNTAGHQGLEEYAGLSFCMLLAMVVYAVSTLFFHIAYSSYLPTVAGITAATYFAARRTMGGLP